MSLLDGLARHLDAAGLGEYAPSGVQTAEWSIFLEALPTTPGKAIALFQYAGGESHGNLPWDDVSVQVRVRGTEDTAVSRARAALIYSALHGLSYTTLTDPDSTYVTDCLCDQGGPVHVGPDSNGWHSHTVNFRVSIDNPTTHRPAT